MGGGTCMERHGESKVESIPRLLDGLDRFMLPDFHLPKRVLGSLVDLSCTYTRIFGEAEDPLEPSAGTRRRDGVVA